MRDRLRSFDPMFIVSPVTPGSQSTVVVARRDPLLDSTCDPLASRFIDTVVAWGLDLRGVGTWTVCWSTLRSEHVAVSMYGYGSRCVARLRVQQANDTGRAAAGRVSISDLGLVLRPHRGEHHRRVSAVFWPESRVGRDGIGEGV